MIVQMNACYQWTSRNTMKILSSFWLLSLFSWYLSIFHPEYTTAVVNETKYRQAATIMGIALVFDLIEAAVVIVQFC